VIKPYLRVVPPALSTRGGEVITLAESLGIALDAEQKLCLNDILSTDEQGKLVAYRAVISMARQCGKTVVAELYSLYFALQGEAVLYTTHRSDAARQFFKRVLVNLGDEHGAEIRRTNGQEEVEFASGGAVVFRTRGPRVGRSFSFDRVVFDEAQHCDQEAVDAAAPTLRTKANPQQLYLGCAANGNLNANCAVLYELRETAVSASDDSLCYLEWSGVAVDQAGEEIPANEMTDDMLDDVETWRRALAGDGRRVTEEHLRRERGSSKMSATSFATECLNVWVPPLLGGASASPVSFESWIDLADESLELPGPTAEGLPAVVVGFDMNVQREVSIVLVGRLASGLLYLELVGKFAGSTAAMEALRKLTDREDIDVVSIVADGEPSNMDLIHRLEHEFILTPRQKQELGDARQAGIKAAGALLDLIAERRFQHRGQRELGEAVRGAAVKHFTDSWAFSRSKSRSDVSPLIAASVALHVAEVKLDLAGAAELVIY
jgi:hypothetical protein